MPRGYGRYAYVDDQGKTGWLWVDRDSASDVNRGWISADPVLVAPLGRQTLPRRVVGIDVDGHFRYARVATVGAALWVGTATQWTYTGTDSLPHVATVVGRQSERRPGQH